MYSEKILGGKWFKKGVTADLKRCFLKLEINEWLQIGSDELIDNEHDEGANHNHQQYGHLGKPNAVTTLEVLWQPVDNQTYCNENEHIAIVVHDLRNPVDVPKASHLVDHVLGGVPCRFIGFGRVEVGAATEKQSREGDEGEGLENGPSILQPLPSLLAAHQVVNHSYHIASQHNETPNEKHIEHWSRQINGTQAQCDGDD